MSAIVGQQALATHLAGILTKCNPVVASVPRNIVGAAAYVWPASPWMITPEDGGYCRTRSVGLVVDLIAPAVDIAEAQVWLAARIEEVWIGCSSGVIVLPGEVITPETVQRPAIMQPEGGGVFLMCTIEFSRFDLED